jgi:hypothetical protein
VRNNVSSRGGVRRGEATTKVVQAPGSVAWPVKGVRLGRLTGYLRVIAPRVRRLASLGHALEKRWGDEKGSWARNGSCYGLHIVERKRRKG